MLRAAGWVFAGWGSEACEEEKAPTDQERPETKPDSHRTPASMLATAGALLVLALIFGLWPALHTWTQQAAGRFLDYKGYQAVVLEAHPTGPVGMITGQPARTTGGSLAFGFGTTLTAVVIASLSLLGDYLPAVFHRLSKRLLDPPLSRLMGLHSGNVCDYAAWLAAGMAALAALFTLALLR